MKNLIKGGLLYLLSHLCTFHLASGQNGFIKYDVPMQEDYGKILSPLLSDSIADALVMKNLSFPEWASFFSVKTAGGNRSVLGRYRVVKNRVAYTPRFLPDTKIPYLISFNHNALAELLSLPKLKKADSVVIDSVQYFQLQSAPVSEVQWTYPHINVLPENTLRMYIYFTAPMSFDNPLDYIDLYDQQGKVIENAFVEVPEGLWNQERTRLTLLFHPGRVKQEVGPNRIEGSILEEGKLFELRVSGRWNDANGSPLNSDYSKKFFVTKAKRQRLRKKDWVIESICKDECVLRLSTGDIPDIELFKKMVQIQDENAESLDFEYIAEANGSFILRSDALKKGSTLTMGINPKMEDISGNTFLNAFDSKEGTRIDKGKPIEIQIDVK